MAKTHGMRKHPLYKTWAEMRYRCNNPKKWQYKHYGARGVRVCERWESFPAFVEDMGERPPGYTLDRIDVNGNYEPSNCRWASRMAQANNARSNRVVEFRGERKTLCEWGRETGIAFSTIWLRLRNGWLVEDALTRPVRDWHPGKPRTQSSNLRAEGKAYA